jgi:hypothetical protein
VTKTSRPGAAYAKLCTNVTSLFEALDISLSANVIEPGWSADAKAELVASLNISSTPSPGEAHRGEAAMETR